MGGTPTYEELERRVKQLEAEAFQREKTQEILLSEKHFHESLINSLPGLFCLFEENGRINRWNENWERVAGCTPEEISRKGPLEYFEGKDRDEVARSIQEVFATGRATVEAGLRTNAGKLTPFLFTGLRLEMDGRKYLCWSGIDISRRKTLEDALRKANEALESRAAERSSELLVANEQLRSASLYARSLIEASLDPLVTISADGKITDVNRATEEATGMVRDELIGTDFSDYFTEPEKAKEGYKRVLLEESVRDYPLALRHRSGTVAHVLYNATLYRNEAGAVQGIFAAARDITGQRRAERELQKHAQMLDFANDTIMIFSLSGEIMYWNKGAQALYGWSEQEALGNSVHQFLKTSFPLPLESIRNLLLETGHWEGELVHAKRDGRKVLVGSRWTLQCDEHDTPFAILEINCDITERKQAENELRAMSLYVRSLIEASLDPLVTISAGGKIMDVNEATEIVTGRSRGELIGSDFSDYFTDPGSARAGYKRVFLEGAVKDYPLAIRHRSGSVTEVLYNASLYKNESGDVEGVFAAARDITMRKLAEEELKVYTARLEQSNRDLENFAFIASHDLKEPLRKIQVFGNLLNVRYADRLDEVAGDYIRRMWNAAARMQTLIEDLLKYSRLRTRFEPATLVDLNRVVAEVLGDLADSLQKTGGIVEFTGLPTIRANETKMRQLFQNLIGNALKFHGEKKPVVRIHHSITGGGVCRIFVEDNGIGFQERYLEKIFAPFQRLHDRSAYEGTGIGLAICQRIVEQHDGTITATSRPGVGSTFIVTLPVDPRPKGGQERSNPDIEENLVI